MTPATEQTTKTKGRRSHGNSLFYTAADLLEMLPISSTALYRLADSGEIPSDRIGGKIVFPKAGVDHYIRSKGAAK